MNGCSRRQRAGSQRLSWRIPTRPLESAVEETVTDTHGATPSSRLSIDHTGKEPFQQALLPPDGTAASASARTVLDLTQVTFMDSSGITVLVAAYQAATRAGGWLRIAGAQGSRPTRPADRRTRHRHRLPPHPRRRPHRLNATTPPAPGRRPVWVADETAVNDAGPPDGHIRVTGRRCPVTSAAAIARPRHRSPGVALCGAASMPSCGASRTCHPASRVALFLHGLNRSPRGHSPWYAIGSVRGSVTGSGARWPVTGWR
ncbi:STAS domain-containing protein [Streptomyces tauricus]|uniref:STAS domain-containing protein n=1 Tax=Streptomyces tauricus TaxID=68274 RepID=UPI002E2C99D0|nr:STAS domain-containing protein [Streptomyces tauricus]